MPALVRAPLQPPAIEDLKEREMSACDPRRLLDEKRSEANRRERSRVRALTDNFDLLVDAIPRDVAEPRLARIEIVRRASGYIRFLTEILESERPDQTATRHPSVWDYIPVEEDDLNRDVLRGAYLHMKGGVKVLPMKRVECNARARSRSKDTKAAFDSLKEKLPLYGTEPELSRLEILRRATDYIASMTLLLQEEAGDEGTRPKSSTTPSTPSTPSNDDRDSVWGRGADDVDRCYHDNSTVDMSSSSPSLASDRQSNPSPSEHAHCVSALTRDRLQSVASVNDSDYGTSSPTSVSSESYFSFDDISPLTSVSRTWSSPCTSPTVGRRSFRMSYCHRAHPYAGRSFSPARPSSQTQSPFEPIFAQTNNFKGAPTTSFSPLSSDESTVFDFIDFDWLDGITTDNFADNIATALPVTPSLTSLHL